jgi:acetylornithine deacetylase/succinyl-diaminopimelate desuccinylase-like protein
MIMIMESIKAIDNYIEKHLEESIAEISRLCAQPSVSAQNWGLKECAALVGEMLSRRKFEVTIIPTEGAPVVFAERKGRSNKTLLFYNHYDVQPAEPLELWVTPPFEPTLRDGKLYARGVVDDKGHFISRLFAIDALLADDNELPCNIKFVLEGEEETSSVHLHDFMREHYSLLKADACIWESGGVDFHDAPQQYLGMRGICYVELSVETANQDVHSGLGGSIFPNAAWRLIWALNTLKGPNEKIQIPGFYDAVQAPNPRQIALFEALPDPAEEYKQRFGIKSFLKGLTGGVAFRQAAVFEPTCTICGLTSGYQGPGSKTVLPARASAKIDFRLVPEQTPEEIFRLLIAHLDSQGFSDIKVQLLGGECPAVTNPDDPFVKLVEDAARDVYDLPMITEPMIGGSGPNAIFKQYLGLPIVSAGIGHPGSQAHAPNENIRLDLYIKGTQHVARIIKAFSVN